MRMNRRQMMKGAALTGAALTFATYKDVLAQTGPIRISAQLPLSGPAAIIGQTNKIGSDITMEMINKAGGINGRPLELVYMDDKGRPADAVAIAREAAGNGFKIWGGGIQSVNVLALLPVLQEAKAVLVTGGASAIPLVREQFSRNLFPGIENDYQRGRALARLAAEKYPNVTKWGGVITDIANYHLTYKVFGKFLTEYYEAKGKKIKVAEPVAIKFGTNEFRTNIAQIASSDVEGMFSTLVGADNITFWKQARQFRLNDKLKAIMDQSTDISIAKVMKRDIPDCWSMVAWYSDLYKDHPGAKAFFAAYKEKTGDSFPPGYVHYGNVFTAGIAAGLKAAAGSSDVDTFINKLEALKFDTIKGDTYFRKEDHHYIADINFVKYAPADDELGFKITESFKLPGADAAFAPDPGKPFDI